MSGISQSVVLDVCRIEASFVDPVGNVKRISSTGFWLLDRTISYFVTNKHNLDPRLKLGANTEFALEDIKIELRQFDGNDPQSSTKFFEVDLANSEIRCSAEADAAVLVTPKYLVDANAFRCGRILKVSDLADASFHINSVALMDLASFIGYPGQPTSRWWDRDWNLGVARVINIASVPGIPFVNDAISTVDVSLVSGLSFAGSSGSVVLLHEKGTAAGVGMRSDAHVSPKILGVMSGHWWDHNEPEMFRHSGLSYYTRSTSILALL